MSRIVLRWLSLTLAGWLAYVLLRALWTLIALGVPFYDWQWYVPVRAMIAWRLSYADADAR